MLIDLITEDPRWQEAGLDTLAENAARAALAHLGLVPAAHEIALLACDDARIATLNTEFRGKPVPTNVLSWPDEDLAAEEAGAPPALPDPSAQDPEEALFLGDIAISYDTCAREAADQAKPFADHVTHLILHATLHLLGYDHIRDKDATLMETLEIEILGKMGIANPY
ncbi:rRNA maturation RNase YbeY [Lentibacter sp. XHP0401]|jgi:probable rRNA maturation factor|uniref:rRNA maturation RNase YbeY n=1 Tax=Lentibacter sp. XHP0401 TaxID=2984334 RepID=UPI0021E8713E|nr:rRNA maturation RNase YbeY [Lentibacter sp. XHP0401]MCV2894547.1 rRNA maturation RNase YbeY [Lentibacter sp. XHP0401]